jgi:large subunit ribosomal protein L27
MAHKKGGGSSRNGRDSQSQRRGVKAHDGSVVTGGTIIVRQCGTVWSAAKNVGQGRDFTLFAKVPGRIHFYRKGDGKKFVEIIEVA